MANPRSVRYLNEMRALNVLFRRGGMSRSDLARELGLNRSSVGFIVDNLIANGLAREREDDDGFGKGAREPRAGRPGIVVELDSAGAIFVGVEIGVDHITIVAIDLEGQEINRHSRPYPTNRVSAEKCVSDAADILNAVVGSFGIRRDRIKGICAAVPALVQEGVAINGLMLGWRHVPLWRILSEQVRLEAPIVVENDANAFAIGETYIGSLERSDTVAFLLIENGCGGGIVIDGRLVRGSHGFAGEFGQLPIAVGPRVQGKLETLIGKDGLLARYRANGAPPSADLPHLLAAAAAGDSIGLRTAEEWGEVLARGLAYVTNVLNPSLIILGGSVAALFDPVAHRVDSTLRSLLLEGFPTPKIARSRLGVEGAAFGAACLLHQQMFAVDESLLHAQATTVSEMVGATTRQLGTNMALRE